jgi:flagellar biosynthesis GTPase FlhF
MAFDTETVKGILSNEETSVDDKIKSLLGEHESVITNLKQKNGEIIGNEKKLKEQLKAEQDKAVEAAKKASSLEEELKKNSPEENRKMYEARLAEVDLQHKAELEKLTQDRDALRESHFTRLRNDAINEAIKEMKFVDGLKDGFIARVMALHTFEPKDIEDNGEYQFYNSAMKDIGSVIHEFSLTKEGKAYIQNPATGGGAAGSGGTTGGGNTVNRERFDAMSQVERIDFFGKGGKIAS